MNKQNIVLQKKQTIINTKKIKENPKSNNTASRGSSNITLGNVKTNPQILFNQRRRVVTTNNVEKLSSNTLVVKDQNNKVILNVKNAYSKNNDNLISLFLDNEQKSINDSVTPLEAIVREEVYIEDLLLNLGAIQSTPVAPLDITNKLYVDSLVSQQQDITVVYLNTISGNDNNNGLTTMTAFATLGRALRVNSRDLTINVSAGSIIDLEDETLLCGNVLINIVGPETFIDVLTELTLSNSTQVTPRSSDILTVVGGGLVPNAHIGQFVLFTDGVFVDQKFPIVANDATTITVAGGLLTAGLTSTISIVTPNTQF
ncbi:MAG: hypothetical protein KIT69_16740, partial [Propionibacteriaceae bacterium]|nr:hypothetical protein [Propionibacteriaceae bacterium]